MKLWQILVLASCVVSAAENVTLPIPTEVNGRKVEAFWQGSEKQWGYAHDQKDLYLVQHPSAQFDKPGAPLYVVLHSAGHSALTCINCTKTKGNHDIYHAPENFYALYLDCRANITVDWWWGSKAAKGFELSPCEKRVMETVERVIKEYKIDRERVYLCGNSMGGSGTLGIGLRHGDVFAALKANVPAGTEHAAARLALNAATAPNIPEPPFLIDYSAQNDKWSDGHEVLIKGMRARKYGWAFFWGAFGHANNNEVMAKHNDIIHSIDWLSIKLHDIYPAFTDATTDDLPPWLAERNVTTCGQLNGFFRWRDAKDSANGASISLYIIGNAELGSKLFTAPTRATATVTLRRLQNLKVQCGDKLNWEFGSQRGTITIGADGLVTVPALNITTAPTTLKLSR